MAGEIFISYRRSDLAQARKLHDLLKAEDVDAWYDAHVGAGQDWRAATAAALSKSRIFVLLFSKAASESDDIAKELAAATFSKKLVIPVRIEDIQPEGAFLYELASRNWVNAFEDTDARLAELARSLATLARSGSQDLSGLPFDRDATPPRPRRQPRWRKLALMGLGVVAASVVLGAGIAIFGNNGPTAVPSRIAFFGVDAPADDKDAQSAASAANSTILTTFTKLQRDVAASADTEGTPAKDRLARAARLRATYTIGGSLTRLGDQLSIAMRVEDTPSHTLLWSDPVQGPANNPSSLGARVAALLNDRMNCIIEIRAGLPVDDIRVVARLPAACESIRMRAPGDAERWQDLAALAPNSAILQAGAASSFFEAIPKATPAQAEDLKKRAIEALHRAEAIDPKVLDVATARIDEAELRGASLKEIEDIHLEAIRNAPRSANANGTYAHFLAMVGRLRDSVPYGQAALNLDPLSNNKMIGFALATMRSGAPVADAEALFAQRHALFPDQTEWVLHLLAALFNGVGDVNAILADPPPDASAKLRGCMTDFVGLASKHTPAGNKAAALSVAKCETDGTLLSALGTEARAHVGDYQPIFAPDADSSTNRLLLFDPSIPGLRARPDFQQLVEKMGLLDYWRGSRHPDFCNTEKAPVCATIAAK